MVLFTATNGGAVSAEGAALQRLPPYVAAFRICGMPTLFAEEDTIGKPLPDQRRAFYIA